MTNFFGYFPRTSATAAMSIERQQGINLANAAMKTPTLKHYIWSTLPDIAKISGGKFQVPHVIGKNQVDQYIKSNEALCKKTTVVWCKFYASNFGYPFYTPTFAVSLVLCYTLCCWGTKDNQATTGKYLQFAPVPANTTVESIGDITKNYGVFTSALLAQPEIT